MKSVSKWQKFREFLINCFEHSSLHGVWHLARVGKNHSIEIVFWALTIISIIIFATTNVLSVWQRFLYNSTVITIDRDYLNRNVTFPPLTLCHRERLNETAMEEFLMTSFGGNKSVNNDEVRKFLWNLAHFNISNLNELIDEKQNYFNVENYLDIIMKISNKFPRSISLTSSHSEEVFFFDPILIDELGLCYTFNSKISPFLSPSFISDGKLEKSNATSQEINYFDGDASATVSDIFNNVDIYFHGPYEIQSESKRILNEDIKQKSYISLKFAPLIIESDEKIRRDLYEFQRKCKFETEGESLYFLQKIYSQDLCRYECKMKKFLEICKCLPFFYPRLSSDQQCNKSGMKCILHNKAIVESLRADVDCKCLKDCNEIKFSLQSAEQIFANFYNSRVEWTFMQSKVIYRRELLHGLVEALILTGGSLSLFLGMSALSIIEIGFFVYLYCKHK